MHEYLDYPEHKPSEGQRCLVAWTKPEYGNSYSLTEATYLNGNFVRADLVLLGVFEYKVLE